MESTQICALRVRTLSRLPITDEDASSRTEPCSWSRLDSSSKLPDVNEIYVRAKDGVLLEKHRVTISTMRSFRSTRANDRESYGASFNSWKLRHRDSTPSQGQSTLQHPTDHNDIYEPQHGRK